MSQSFNICLLEPVNHLYAHFLHDLAKFLSYGIQSSGHQCSLTRNNLSPDRTNVIFGWHLFADPGMIEVAQSYGSYILLLSEVLGENEILGWNGPGMFSKLYLPLMLGAQEVWTGIESNFPKLDNLGVRYRQFPQLGYHPALEEIHHRSWKDKDIDFLFYGSIVEHRTQMLESLWQRIQPMGYKMEVMFDSTSIFRNDLISRSKIILAPHQGPGSEIFCPTRVLYLLNNKCIVIVEKCRGQELYEECFPSADTDHWIDLGIETIQRPDIQFQREVYYEKYQDIKLETFMIPFVEGYLKDRA